MKLMIDEKLNPVWYVSHKFNTAERNYAPRDQEMLAVIYALRKFRSYLLCRTLVRLYSDHESLSKFQKQPDLKKRDWRWAELLSDYTYEQYYRPGLTMFVPDAISRAFMGPE